MNHRTHAFLAVLTCVTVMSACASKPARPCTGYYLPAAEFGFCELPPNQARALFDKGVW